MGVVWVGAAAAAVPPRCCTVPRLVSAEDQDTLHARTAWLFLTHCAVSCACAALELHRVLVVDMVVDMFCAVCLLGCWRLVFGIAM